jgi:hypothetical protein
MDTQTAPPQALARRFQTFASEWRSVTRFLSSPSAASTHPSYRAIVELGTVAVPLILAELAESPDPWFAALRELTGDDPVPSEDVARPTEAAEHWLAWGRTRGLV